MLPRVLCLHGKYQSAAVLQHKLQPLQTALGSKVELGTHTYSPRPAVARAVVNLGAARLTLEAGGRAQCSWTGRMQ